MEWTYKSPSLLALVFLTCVSISFAYVDCRINPDFNYPNPEDFGTFLSCSGKRLFGPRRCADPNKTQYDPYTNKCDWTITGEPTKYADCTGIVDGRLITNPDASDCRTCFKCMGGKTTPYTCPSDSKFDPNQMACDFLYSC